MDVVAGHWGVGAAVDNAAGTAEGLASRLRRDKEEGLPVWTRLRDIAEAVGRGGGAAAVDKAAGTAKLSLLWTWLPGAGEGLPP